MRQFGVFFAVCCFLYALLAIGAGAAAVYTNWQIWSQVGASVPAYWFLAVGASAGICFSFGVTSIIGGLTVLAERNRARVLLACIEPAPAAEPRAFEVVRGATDDQPRQHYPVEDVPGRDGDALEPFVERERSARRLAGWAAPLVITSGLLAVVCAIALEVGAGYQAIALYKHVAGSSQQAPSTWVDVFLSGIGSGRLMGALWAWGALAAVCGAGLVWRYRLARRALETLERDRGGGLRGTTPAAVGAGESDVS